jgi:hypothetical protein
MFTAPCLICASPVRIPLHTFLASEKAPYLVRALRARGERAPLNAVVCARCAITRPEVLCSNGSSTQFFFSSAVIAMLVAAAVVFVIVYPVPGDLSLWRWPAIRWPETGGSLMAALGVLVSILLAIGIDLSQQRDVISRARSPWSRDGRGLHLDQFRELREQFDRLELADVVLRLTSAVALGIGVVVLAKAVAMPHLESAITATIAAIVVIIGRAMLTYRVVASRRELGLTRAGEIVASARRAQTAEAWQRVVTAKTIRLALIPASALAAPVLVVLFFVPALGWRAAYGVVLAQVLSAASLSMMAIFRMREVGRGWGAKVATVLMSTIFILLAASAVYLVAVTFFTIAGWVGFWVVTFGCMGSFVVAATGLVSRMRLGGGVLVALVRFVPSVRRAATSPTMLDDFFVVVDSTEERDRLEILGIAQRRVGNVCAERT